MPPKFYQGDGNRFIVRWEDVAEGVHARIAAAKLEITAVDLDECLDFLADAVRDKYGDHDPEWDITPRRPLPGFLVDKPRYVTLDSRGVAHYEQAEVELRTPEYSCRECYSTLHRRRTGEQVTIAPGTTGGSARQCRLSHKPLAQAWGLPAPFTDNPKQTTQQKR